jgi:hypothetical protein
MVSISGAIREIQLSEILKSKEDVSNFVPTSIPTFVKASL